MDELSVECVDATDSSLLLCWRDVPGATKYALEWRPLGSETFEPLGKGFSSGMPPKQKSKLPPGAVFEFRVRAGRGGGEDWFAWSPVAVHATLPPGAQRMEPPSLRAAEPEALTVQWRPVPGAVAYELQMRRATDTTWSTVAPRIAGTVRSTATCESFPAVPDRTCSTNHRSQGFHPPAPVSRTSTIDGLRR